MLAAFDEGVARLARVIADAATSQRGWRERVRASLIAALEFFDAEPAWARFLILEPPLATVAVAERRQRALTALAGALAREIQSDAAAQQAVRPPGFSPSPGVVAELVVGGVVSGVRARLLDQPRHLLAALAPSLMSFISTSYAAGDAPAQPGQPVRATYRTTRVLSAIGEAPRSNNREIADAAGLRDEGQTSKLLSRLEQRGLVENVGLGAAYGEPNEWLLTGAGRRVLNTMPLRSLADTGRGGASAARGAAVRSAE
ncbi:MAG TPA: winged helix-turn-helix domain-containing protein [Solirubrobacteraceae bacterium]|nr:winged helix-turn-helix domain-containing protein [Solirubrobacteraceae bacterium]